MQKSLNLTDSVRIGDFTTVDHNLLSPKIDVTALNSIDVSLPNPEDKGEKIGRNNASEQNHSLPVPMPASAVKKGEESKKMSSSVTGSVSNSKSKSVASKSKAAKTSSAGSGGSSSSGEDDGGSSDTETAKKGADGGSNNSSVNSNTTK